MWFSVVCTLDDNDMRHQSGQNVVDSRGAAPAFSQMLSVCKEARSAVHFLVTPTSSSISYSASNFSALAIPNSFFHGCTIANANVYVSPKNHCNLELMKAVGAILERFRSENEDESVFYCLLKVHIRGCAWPCVAGGKLIGKGILRTVVSQAEFCAFFPPFLCEVCHPISHHCGCNTKLFSWKHY